MYFQNRSNITNMRLFLDDYREPSHCLSYMHLRIGPKHILFAQDWKVVRNFKEFIEAVTTHHKDITLVSFDHDLSDEHYHHTLMDDPALLKNFYKKQDREMTGFDCAVWMRDFYLSKGLSLPVILVHSMNPLGTVNIEEVFSHAGIHTPLAEPEADPKGQEN